MKKCRGHKFLQTALLVVVIIMSGCNTTRAIYGVPEEKWESMNDQERSRAIKNFKRQEKINAQTRTQAEKAKQEAEEFASKCHTKENMPYPSECRVITRRRWGLK